MNTRTRRERLVYTLHGVALFAVIGLITAVSMLLAFTPQA